MGLQIPANYRIDPFADTVNPVAISNEKHTIPDVAPFEVVLNEVPKQESPSTVIISGFTEVPGSPSPREFRVDYQYQTGKVQFHASDSGTPVLVSYKGLGSPIIIDYLNKLSIQDPSNSFFNDWWRFEEVGDHFSTPASTPRINMWSSITTNNSFHDHVVETVASGTQFAYLGSHSIFKPGYGFILSTRFKLNKAAPNLQSRMILGCGSVNTAQDHFDFLAAITVSHADGRIVFVGTTVTGLGFTSGAFLSSGTALDYNDYTLIYTPGYATFIFNNSISNTVDMTFQPDLWVNTVQYAPAVVGTNGDAEITDLILSVDYFSFVPTSTLVSP